VNIRAIANDDFDEAMPLLKQLWPNHELNFQAVRKVFTRAVESSDQILLGAVSDQGSLIGLVVISERNSLWAQGPLGYMDILIVDEKHRSGGVGERLLHAAEAEASARGYKAIDLAAGFQREGAHRFYERHEYVRDAILFSKSLT